jgi:rubrerythrin
MNKKIMEERIRQLLAVDQNAFDIYTNLAKLAQTKKMKSTLLIIAADEKRHAEYDHELLKLILE